MYPQEDSYEELEVAVDDGEGENDENEGKMTAMRSILLILIALLIDGLQIFFAFAISAISGLGQIVQLVPIAGQVAGTAIGGIAFGTAIMINLLIDIGAVLAFFFLLKIWGYKAFRVFAELGGAFFIEVMPILGYAPIWTAWAVKFVLEDYSKQALGAVGGETASKLATIVTEVV